MKIPGMELKQDIPLVLEQITKMSSLSKLHASVSQIEFKEIHQNNISLGGRLMHFLENWKLITRDTRIYRRYHIHPTLYMVGSKTHHSLKKH